MWLRASTVIVGVVVLAACGGDPFTDALPAAPASSTVAPERNIVAAEAATTTVLSDPDPDSVHVGPSTSETPDSLPLSTEPTGATLPDGITSADLPDDLGDRLDLMTDWLEDTYPDRSTGHAFSSFDETYDLTFNVDLTDEAEARALCPFFLELASLYLLDTEHSVNIRGWVITSSGFFAEAEWDRFGC